MYSRRELTVLDKFARMRSSKRGEYARVYFLYA